MMKSAYYKWLLISSLLFIFSCTKEVGTIESISMDYSFSIDATLQEMDDETDTKATISSNLLPSWSTGDAISVINLTSKKTLGGNLSATSSGKTAKFSGTVTGAIASGDVLAFIYPSQGFEANEDFNDITFSVQTQQDGASPTFAAMSTYRVQSASSTLSNIECSFTFCISYFKLNIAGLPASSAIQSIEIPGVGTSVVYRINSGGTALEPSAITDGSIKIVPGKSTGTQGTQALKFVTAGANAQSANRRVLVKMGNDINNCGVYASVIAKSKYNPNAYTNLVVSGFSLVGGVYNGQEYVDLGLPSGTMWAKYDVGSSSDAKGTGFMWGMTETKRIANWTYYLCGSSQCGTDADPLLKYYTHQYDFSGTQYDAATANLGGAWRTPTLEDYQELGSIYSGGGKYTGNGNEILFNTSNTDYYWTSTPSEREVAAVSVLHSTSVSYPDFRVRATQFPVRPVFDVFSLSETVLEFPVNPDLSDPSTYPALSISCIDDNVNWRLVDYEKYKMGEKLIYLGDLEGSGNQTVKLNLMPNDEGCERIIELVFEAWYDGDNALFKNEDGTPKVYTKKLHIYQAASEEESVLLPGEVNN